MSQTLNLLKTPFHDFHVSQGARMVDFAGWDMPLLYHSIIAEHQHTRKSASVFDVSHMGRIKFTGPDGMRFLNHLLSRNIAAATVGQSLYSLVCNENGGVLDDVIVSRLEKYHLMVCNASNRLKLLAWFDRHRPGFDVQISDETLQTAMVALQGPKVIELLDSVLPEPVTGLQRYHCTVQRYMFVPFTIFRSGYTGEDGVEVICGNSTALMAIKFLMKSDGQGGNSLVQPAGLGARDTLRLEAGMPLYGHELSETVDPISAGLIWAVAKDKDFVGSRVLTGLMQHGTPQKLVGLLIDSPRTPRQDMPVLGNGKPIGRITSSTVSPTLGRTIAMAYVQSEFAQPGTAVEVDLRGTPLPATITKLPFYKRTV